MADNNFRGYRNRNPIAQGDVDPIALGAASDPLAELARLIGQSDPVGELGRNARHNPAAVPSAAPPAVEDDYAEPDRYAENSDVQPRVSGSYAASRAYPAHDRPIEHAPPVANPYSGQAARFDDADDSAIAHDGRYQDDHQPAGYGRQLPALAPQAHDAAYETDDHWQDGADGQSYAEEYDDEPPSVARRSGIIVIVAVLGLVTLGIAGAFAYRTMFGGTMLPSLPPIIKASDGPNKIIPSHGDGPNDTSSQAGVTNTGSGEKLVSREEQPLNIQTPPNTAPRVISTIPIMSDPNAPSQGAPAAVAPPTGAPAPGAPVAPVPLAAPSPTVASTQPKKVHTVTIRPDQPGSVPAATVPSPPPPLPSTGPAPIAHGATPRPVAAATPRPLAQPAPAGGANAPLALIPQQEQEPPAPLPARTRVARAEAPNAPLAIGAGTSPSPSPSGGGYTVQLTSQRSEADAMAAFRSLRAKFPNQLGSREPIIRRADLGAKGTYYRAMVGPFASAEAAAGMCSNLKAAGGTCLVQRN